MRLRSAKRSDSHVCQEAEEDVIVESKFLIIVLCGAFCGLCCNKSSTGPSGALVIYSNSFESKADTAGWIGVGSQSFVADAPPGGGVQSVRISGGCIIPTASTTLVLQGQANAVGIECWAKSLAGGGFLQLYRTTDRYEGITIEMTDTVWTFYRSITHLSCSAGDTLELDLNSGGIVYGAMLVDEIKIRPAE